MSRITSLSALAALSLGLIAAPLAYAQGGATTTPDTKASAATTQAAPATETAKAPAKAKRVLGYRPRVALDDGLRATADWYRAQGLL